MKLTTPILPKKYWIYSEKRYILKGMVLPQLPYVDSKYESILKAHNIPYRKFVKTLDYVCEISTEVCEYWNPQAGLEKEKLSLPLFAITGNSYVYCEKNYCIMIPTSETITAAKETAKFVNEKINDYEQILHEVSHYRFAKEELSNDIVTVCCSTNTPYIPVYNISMNHENFKILRICGSIYLTNYVAIFNMNKVHTNGYITLKVPKNIVGFVIGKGGKNIQAWAEELKVKKIQVVPI